MYVYTYMYCKKKQSLFKEISKMRFFLKFKVKYRHLLSLNLHIFRKCNRKEGRKEGRMEGWGKADMFTTQETHRETLRNFMFGMEDGESR